MSLCSPADIKEFSLDCMDGEIDVLQKKLAGANQKIGFCHNDLQYGNIMLDEETQAITIIVRLFFIIYSFFSIIFIFQNPSCLAFSSKKCLIWRLSCLTDTRYWGFKTHALKALSGSQLWWSKVFPLLKKHWWADSSFLLFPLHLQDYEYASHNPIAYDIANHFCEMAANYHTETPHILDYNKYPGWLLQYI